MEKFQYVAFKLPVNFEGRPYVGVNILTRLMQAELELAMRLRNTGVELDMLGFEFSCKESKGRMTEVVSCTALATFKNPVATSRPAIIQMSGFGRKPPESGGHANLPTKEEIADLLLSREILPANVYRMLEKDRERRRAIW